MTAAQGAGVFYSKIHFRAGNWLASVISDDTPANRNGLHRSDPHSQFFASIYHQVGRLVDQPRL